MEIDLCDCEVSCGPRPPLHIIACITPALGALVNPLTHARNRPQMAAVGEGFSRAQQRDFDARPQAGKA
jgi:hypothetical protein